MIPDVEGKSETLINTILIILIIATFIYKLTKKLHLVTRFDDFNNNTHIKNNNTREYSAGINYYILGQTLKLVLDYVFCQNQSRDDSHKIMIGTQVLL